MSHAHGTAPQEPIEGSFRPRPACGLLTTELEGELLLLDKRTDRLHRLDPLGTVIWNVLDGEVTVDELVADLADVFQAPRGDVRADLDNFVAALRAVGLLDGVEPPGGHLVAESTPESAPVEGLWRPKYLVDPPAP